MSAGRQTYARLPPKAGCSSGTSLQILPSRCSAGEHTTGICFNSHLSSIARSALSSSSPRRDVSFPSWMKLGRDFDLKKFTGSFSRVADFSAWYPSGKAAEDAAADEDARGSTQVLHYMRLACQ